MPTVATPTSSWVHAAPFRAHLRHVCAASGLPWQVLAVHARVSLSLADHLLHGRRGRPVHRITRQNAVQLLGVTAEGAARLASRWVPSETATRLVAQFVDRGWATEAIAKATGVDPTLLRALRLRAPAQVPQLDDLRLRALAATLHRDVAAGAAA